MSILAATVAPNSITVIANNGNTMTITGESHRNYDEIREAVKLKDYNLVQELIDLASQMIAKFSSVAGSVRIEHGVLYFGSRAIAGVLGERAVQMHSEGFEMGPMFAFVENLYQNPSHRAVTQLYGFLEATDLPITEDGHFLAYKMIRNDYTDCYTGKMDNSIGAVPEMDRFDVNENPDETCSSGLHFCSQGYLGSYGNGHNGRTVIVKVNPRDVVSIPSDYNNAKGRACKYEIVGEFEVQPDRSHSFGSSVADSNMEKTGVSAPVAATQEDRPHKIRGIVKVYTDQLFKTGDVVFKADLAKKFDIDIADLIEALEINEIDSVILDNGIYLPVINHKFNEWVEEYRAWN